MLTVNILIAVQFPSNIASLQLPGCAPAFSDWLPASPSQQTLQSQEKRQKSSPRKCSVSLPHCCQHQPSHRLEDSAELQSLYDYTVMKCISIFGKTVLLSLSQFKFVFTLLYIFGNVTVFSRNIVLSHPPSLFLCFLFILVSVLHKSLFIVVSVQKTMFMFKLLQQNTL